MVSPCPDNPGRGVWSAFAAAVACASAHGAVAGSLQPPPDYGYQFATITHPGNAPTVTFPMPGVSQRIVGGVDHLYRISKTETTNRQWHEFVLAYAPFVDPRSWGSESFIGRGMIFNGVSGGVPQYLFFEAYADRPTEIGWEFAARYSNWLHNGKKPVGQASAADFDGGAYDMSQYGAPGWNSVHEPGAKYWIPTRDEWVKAAYWDPNKNGPDQPGYWKYPITSDTVPIPGDPSQGGQTNAGPFPPGQTRPLDVGSYPTITSPWGLLDTSGGLEEWVQDASPFFSPREHFIVGSNYHYQLNPAVADLLVRTFLFDDGRARVGFRIVSAVPGPMAAPVLVGLAFFTTHTRRLRPCRSPVSSP